MDYSKIASQESIERTIAALKDRNVEANLSANKTEALAKIKELIPASAAVMTGSSTTLEEIGFVDFLKSGDYPWKNLKGAIALEKDPVAQSRLRKEATLADYFLGSVHAVTEEGDIIVASGTGSQLPSYAYGSANVIWVVGAQKIVPNLDEAMRRLKEYVVPLEDQRMKSVGASGTNLAKILIFKNESPHSKRKMRLLFVNEKLGF